MAADTLNSPTDKIFAPDATTCDGDGLLLAGILVVGVGVVVRAAACLGLRRICQR